MQPIHHAIEAEATNLWIVQAELQHSRGSKPKLFRSLDAATQYVGATLARNLRYTADMKERNGSDDAESPIGTLTGLVWNCPTRPMTKDECLASGSEFAKDWIKSGNPPHVRDPELARKQQVEFVDEAVTYVSIYRVSRYLGYIRRASVLNDKSRDIGELIAAWNDLNAPAQ